VNKNYINLINNQIWEDNLKKIILVMCITVLFFSFGCTKKNKINMYKDNELKIAVEYTNHAASYYYAKENNYFEEKGLKIENTNIYVSGVNLAAAFSKGEFDIGYMCVVPAITAYANAGVPIKIIAGTHKNGYGLVVNKEKIKELKDLEKDNIIISNGRKGTTTDFLMMVLVEKENLDSNKILKNTVRMNATKQIMALKNGQVDAVFVPEHFATLASNFKGMEMLVKSNDIWKDMQGSVLVATNTLIKEKPKIIEKIKKINRLSIESMGKNPEKTGEIIAESLNINQSIAKKETKNPGAEIEVTSLIAEESMKNLRVTTDIDELEIQRIIDQMYSFGYIKEKFNAKEIMIKN